MVNFTLIFYRKFGNFLNNWVIISNLTNNLMIYEICVSDVKIGFLWFPSKINKRLKPMITLETLRSLKYSLRHYLFFESKIYKADIFILLSCLCFPIFFFNHQLSTRFFLCLHHTGNHGYNGVCEIKRPWAVRFGIVKCDWTPS